MRGKKCLYVYALKDKLKIGITTDIVYRVTQLNYKYPNPILIYVSEYFDDNSYEKERLVHNRLSQYRLNGEWFSTSPNVAINEIKKVCGSPGFISNENNIFFDFGIPRLK